MHTKIEQLYPGRIKITDYFSYPTIAKVAEFIINSGSEPLKKLPLTFIELPAEYFQVEMNTSKEVSLKLSFDSGLETKLRALAEQGSICADDIFLAVYAYLFTQITGTERITIQAALSQMDQIHSLDIELTNINKFMDLADLVAKNLQKIDPDKTYQVKDLISLNPVKDRLTVLPLFYKTGAIGAKHDILNVYDIAMELNQEGGTLNCLCRYNGRKLNKAKMKEFAGLYIKLLELFLE
jgi:hypothetical protein